MDTFYKTSHIFHRSFDQKPRHVVSPSGLIITLDDDTTIIKATGAPAVACLGHDVPEVAAAIASHLTKVGHLFSGGGYSEGTTEAIAAHILAGAPCGLIKAIFVNSGSEAADAVLKPTTQYWHARGRPERCNFIARR